MKHETKAKLDKIVPLLAHWMEGGRLKVAGHKSVPAHNIYISNSLEFPDNYTIQRTRHHRTNENYYH